MESSQDERFMIFVRHNSSLSGCPALVERPLAMCSSYAEARRIRREFRYTARDCVIRYVGPAGGGD